MSAQAQPMPSGWPQDADGNYLAIVTGTASDLIPTVQFGNVLIGPVSIARPVAATTLADIILHARDTQKAAEYVVGAERRLAQWAVEPSSRVINPATGVAFNGAGEQMGMKPDNLGAASPAGDYPAPEDPPAPAPAPVPAGATPEIAPGIPAPPPKG